MTTTTAPLRRTPDGKLRTDVDLRRVDNFKRIGIALYFRRRRVTVTYVQVGEEHTAVGDFLTAAYLDHGTTRSILVLDTGATRDQGAAWGVPLSIPLSQVVSIVEVSA